MRKRVLRVYDSVVDTNGDYTGKQWNEQLGEFDRFGIMVVVDTLFNGTTATLSLYIDHSSDGTNWLAARRPAQLPLHTTPDLQVMLGHFDSEVGTYVDPCNGVSRATGTAVTGGPLLHFVRFFMILDVTGCSAHARVHVFQRDL